MAYRTTSADPVLAKASLIPIHLMVDQRRRTYGQVTKKKKLERISTIRRWQEQFYSSPRDGLIKDVSTWINRNHAAWMFRRLLETH